MRPETAEWVEKAEGDYRTAEREAAVTEFANFDAVCFHAQQCAEKYLKALLVEHGVYFPRTHHLLSLLDLLPRLCAGAEKIRTELANLSPYAVDVRYPGDCADAPAAHDALADCTKARAALRELLSLSERVE